MHNQTHGPGQKDIRPWHRLPEEGAKPYSAFEHYLELGSLRDLKTTARRLGKSYALIRRWSSRYRWRERARAWDEVHGRVVEEEQLASWREFSRRREEEVQYLWRLAVALIQRFVRRDPATDQLSVDPRLGPREVVALLRLVSDLLERVSARTSSSRSADERIEIQLQGFGLEGDDGASSPRAAIEHPGLRKLLGAEAQTDVPERTAQEVQQP